MPLGARGSVRDGAAANSGMRSAAVQNSHAQDDLIGTRRICDHHGHSGQMVERPILVFVSEQQVDGRAGNRHLGVRENERLGSTTSGRWGIDSMFSSTISIAQSDGESAANVARPRGGFSARFPGTTFSTVKRKLQKLSGDLELMRNNRIGRGNWATSTESGFQVEGKNRVSRGGWKRTAYPVME